MDDNSSETFADFASHYPKTFDALLTLRDNFGHEVASSAARVIQLIASRQITEEVFDFPEETMEFLNHHPNILSGVQEAAFIFIQEQTGQTMKLNLKGTPTQ